MSDVLVLGGGICGLATAMMLARDGHDVTVVERDREEAPVTVEDAIERWDRPGVAQFRQAHYMHARFRHVLDAELPQVRDALIEVGGLRYDLLKKLFPPSIADTSPRPDDDKYWSLTARRPVLEAVFSRCAREERGVKVMRGAHVTGLLKGPDAISGVPHIVGAVTSDGAELRADVVIDAMGRKSLLNEWIPALGGRAPIEEAEDCGFTYYGQYFHGTLPDPIGPLVSEQGTISVLTLPSDNDTWMVVVWIASGDTPLKQLRFPEKWRKAVAAVPLQAHWLDGEPLGDLEMMSGIMDRYRRFVVDGQPIATGIFPVADAWACTNPSLGRGVSLGVWHASLLRELIARGNGDPGVLSKEWDSITEKNLTPWYRTQVDMDRARVRAMDAEREGRDLPEDPGAEMLKAFMTSVGNDADMFRAFLEIMGCLATPEEILGRPGMFEKMVASAHGKQHFATPGPTREELLTIVA